MKEEKKEIVIADRTFTISPIGWTDFKKARKLGINIYQLNPVSLTNDVEETFLEETLINCVQITTAEIDDMSIPQLAALWLVVLKETLAASNRLVNKIYDGPSIN